MTNTTNDVNGFLLADKSSGRTSFKVVERVRASLGGIKVGHAGTLDPIATGLLILAAGRTTKKILSISRLEKEYEFTVLLGKTTDTDDTEGAIIKDENPGGVTEEEIRQLLPAFTGQIEQMPPLYSSKKIKGKRAYAMARKGKEVKLKKSTVHIYKLALTELSLPSARFTMTCSTGTYVRSFARDFGEKLGCGGCVAALRRTRIGPFRVEEALGDDQITESTVRERLMGEAETIAAAAHFRGTEVHPC